MTDLAEAPEALSTTLDPTPDTGVSGGGAPRVITDADEPSSLRDTIAEEVKKDTEEPKEAPEKPEDKKADPEAKEPTKAPERGADGKFAAKESAKEDGEAQPKAEADTGEDKAGRPGHIEAPKAFLPDAKETWRNTPRAVQRDVENLMRQHETEITQHREAAQRYDAIRPYDDAARAAGRAGVHESLQEVAQLEQMMQTNPLAALNQVLMRAGPRKADGQPISLFELAQAIVTSGQDGYNQMLRQQPQQAPQQQQANPEVAQLREQIAQMQEQQLAATVIEPFKAQNPRYDELEGDIAFFLQSGRIPSSLSPPDRLAAAYDMAVRINPASHDNDATARTDPEPARRAAETFSAGKSIKSAPGAVTSEMEPERGGSIHDLLVQEMRRAKGSG